MAFEQTGDRQIAGADQTEYRAEFEVPTRLAQPDAADRLRKGSHRKARAAKFEPQTGIDGGAMVSHRRGLEGQRRKLPRPINK